MWQLACARIGAVHSVVFAGFSAESLAGRILDSKPSVVLTASSVKRGAKPINLKVRPPHRPPCLPACTKTILTETAKVVVLATPPWLNAWAFSKSFSQDSPSPP